jgi:ABC-type multidrug transport system permease subunit
MPTYLQNIAHIFPLFYIVDGLGDVMIYNNYGKALIGIFILVVVSAAVFVLAIRAFKWRED